MSDIAVITSQARARQAPDVIFDLLREINLPFAKGIGREALAQDILLSDAATDLVGLFMVIATHESVRAALRRASELLADPKVKEWIA